MPVDVTKPDVTPPPIHLSPEIRGRAEEFSARMGLSLDQFVELAVEARVSLARHEEWIARRRPMTDERIREALAILDIPRGDPMPGDELPEGYERMKY